jgi:hypothetical protein
VAAGGSEPPSDARRVPVEELVDLSRLGRDGRPPTLREIRAALPRGWVLDEDGRTARRDLRLVFREGWILVLGLVSFGAAVLGLFWWSFPRGGAGLVRFALVVGLVLLAGGLVGPWITRALQRR